MTLVSTNIGQFSVSTHTYTHTHASIQTCMHTLLSFYHLQFLFSLKVSSLQTSVNFLVNLFVIPKLNGIVLSVVLFICLLCATCLRVTYILSGYANAGIEIPMVDGVTFESPTLTLGEVCDFRIQ